LLRTTAGVLGLLNVRYEYGPSGERVREEGWHGETRSVGGLYQRTTSKSENRAPRTLNIDTVMTSFLIPADGRIVAEVRFHDDLLRLSMVGVNGGQQPWTSGSFATPEHETGDRDRAVDPASEADRIVHDQDVCVGGDLDHRTPPASFLSGLALPTH